MSLYWRIGLGFVVFVVGVVVVQSGIVSYTIERMTIETPGRSPNNIAAAVAVDIASTVARDAAADLSRRLRELHGEGPQVFAVMTDGRVASNLDRPLPPDIQRVVRAMLGGTDLREAGLEPAISAPFVSAPIVVDGQLRGMAVFPPRQQGGWVREAARFVSLPGTIVLIIGTIAAALVIFGPASRRLRALQDAARRLGAGDLDARADATGGDEIARVAAAFNHMATELEARDSALRTSDRLRRQMIADVSHELKTPLTAMRGYLETLRMPGLQRDVAARQQYIDTAERETRRLERIVKDLLDLARHENGVGELDRRTFDVQKLFDHVIERHAPDADTRRLTMRAAVVPPADQLVGDPDRLEQVIDNLVANALRHTPDGGTIQLRASLNGSGAELSVTDNGEGIAPEHLPFVFDRFYKVDASRAAGSAGSGLGLSIAKAIVERHGGTLAVQSAKGETTFTVHLPHSVSANL